MKNTRFFALLIILVGSVGLRAEDRNLNSTPDARTDTTVAATGPTTLPATVPSVLPAPMSRESLLGARVSQAGAGQSTIRRTGRGLDFKFNSATFNEVIREIARTFDCVVSYSGDPQRIVTGEFKNMKSAAQLLTLLTDMTDLVVIVTQRGFIVQEIDTPQLPTLKLDDVIRAQP